MARATWQGYITLGQLGIPVRLYTATQSLRPHFVRLHERDGSPVERALRCRAEHLEISPNETVRAAEYEPDRYVTLTDQELERTAPAHVKSVDIKQFCSRGSIDPVYYEKPFYAVPGRGGERGYSLLREVLARTGMLAIAQLIMHEREHIAALLVQGDMLVLNQLRFADELLPRNRLKTPPLPKPSPDEIDALTAIVRRFNGPFYIQDYHDEHSEYVRQLIERKAKGLPARRRERIAPHTTPQNEIIATLRSSLGNSTVS